ncbi:MAG: copper resistance protein CopC [Caldilinea sp. CFX5]|nr:copper resistance protein CopC [Caldilinea sp. CFX5]
MSHHHDRRRRWLRRVGIGMLALLVWSAPTALAAHSDLVAADPAPGAQLSSAPTEIRLTFGEANDPWSRVLLFAPGFEAIPGVVTRVNPAAPEQLIAQLPPLAPDTYTVQWVVVATDQHVARGSYTFGVQPQAKGYLWLSVAATLLIWLLLLISGPWRKQLWQRMAQPVNF